MKIGLFGHYFGAFSILLKILLFAEATSRSGSGLEHSRATERKGMENLLSQFEKDDDDDGSIESNLHGQRHDSLDHSAKKKSNVRLQDKRLLIHDNIDGTSSSGGGGGSGGSTAELTSRLHYRRTKNRHHSNRSAGFGFGFGHGSGHNHDKTETETDTGAGAGAGAGAGNFINSVPDNHIITSPDTIVHSKDTHIRKGTNHKELVLSNEAPGPINSKPIPKTSHHSSKLHVSDTEMLVASPPGHSSGHSGSRSMGGGSGGHAQPKKSFEKPASKWAASPGAQSLHNPLAERDERQTSMQSRAIRAKAWGAADGGSAGRASSSANASARVSSDANARVSANPSAKVSSYPSAKVSSNPSSRVSANASARVSANARAIGNAENPSGSYRQLKRGLLDHFQEMHGKSNSL